MSSIFYGVVVFLIGLAVGSFLNVVIYRIPRGENIAFPASHCPNCGHNLKWYHNIPLFSWIFLGGKCAFCKEPISKRYPLIEFINALLWLVVYLKVGFNIEALFIAMTFSALLALSAIDFEYFAVPDSLNFFALATALLASVAKSFESGDYNYAINAFIASLITGGGLWLLAKIISIVAKKEAMGGADVIVAGTMGALLGLSHFFVAIFLSAILAIIPSLRAKDTMVPFVPFLALATFIVFLYDTQTDELLMWIING